MADQAMKLFDRLVQARDYVTPVESQYCIVYEDNMDEPVKVVHPDARWLGCALHGGILPPVWVYLALEEDASAPDFEQHTRGYLLHTTEPVAPMTEEQAMEYLAFKDVPRHVWENKDGSNRPKMLICRKDQLPKTKTWRNAWRLSAGEDNDSNIHH